MVVQRGIIVGVVVDGEGGTDAPRLYAIKLWRLTQGCQVGMPTAYRRGNLAP
jgi:hypothetical protein